MPQYIANNLPRLTTIAATLILGTALSSCSVDLLSKVGLEKKKPTTEVAQSAEPQEMEKKVPAVKTAKAAAYVDPMVAKSGAQKRPQIGLVPMTEKQPAPKPSVPAEMAAQASTDMAPANDLGQVVNQPTAVTASANSIYSLANAQVAAAEGVPAYAPTRNINPMAGSVFSAHLPPQPAAVAPAPSQAKDATEPNSGGLF